MNKIICFLLLLTVLFSCKETVEEYGITVSSEKIEATDNAAFSGTIEIQTEGQWRVNEQIDWCTVTPTTGTGSATITVKMDENTSESDRSAYFRIYNSTDDKTIEIVQPGANLVTEISKLCLDVTEDGGYMQVANNSIFNVASDQSFSVSLKMCCSTNGSGRVLTRRSGTKSGFDLFFNSTGNLAMTFKDDAGLALSTNYTTAVLTDGYWHNISFVFNRGEGYSCLYVDGVLEGKKEHEIKSTNSISSDQPLLFGIKNLDGEKPLTGLIDDVGFYKTALTQNEVTNGMNGVSDESDEKLIAKWNFNTIPGREEIADSINGIIGYLKQGATLIQEGEEPAKIVKSQFVFKSGTENTLLFRSPALVTAINGDLVMAADQRVSDESDVGDNRNINIVIKRSSDNGETWSDTKIIADFPEGESVSDASMIVDQQTGKIFLFTVFYDHVGNKGKFLVFLYESSDNGNTWSDYKDISSELSLDTLLPDRLRFTTNGGGLYLKNGKMRHTLVDPPNNFYMIGSDDHGATWFMKNTAMLGNECKIVELKDGTIMFNARSGKSTFKGRQIHITTDSGEVIKSWDDANLIDPICNADIMSYSSSTTGDVLLFSNCAHLTLRDNLTVKQSSNEGNTWGNPILIDQAGGYSVMTTMKDGSVGLAYENGRNGVKFVRLVFDN
ncbi:MAG: exo-alpha-sialidase [Draconibacterium sp.]